MAEHIRKTFSCDRCGTDLGSERGRQPITVTAVEDGEWAKEWSVNWRDLCEPCRDAVRKMFKRG